MRYALVSLADKSMHSHAADRAWIRRGTCWSLEPVQEREAGPQGCSQAGKVRSQLLTPSLRSHSRLTRTQRGSSEVLAPQKAHS